MCCSPWGCKELDMTECLNLAELKKSGSRLVLSRLFVTPQTTQSMGFFRQVYWSGLPYPPPGDLPNTGMEPKSSVSPALQADSLWLSHWESPVHVYCCCCVVVRSCLALCNPMDSSAPGLLVPYHLLDFAQTFVH